jgi:hypothetical protein
MCKCVVCAVSGRLCLRGYGLRQLSVWGCFRFLMFVFCHVVFCFVVLFVVQTVMPRGLSWWFDCILYGIIFWVSLLMSLVLLLLFGCFFGHMLFIFLWFVLFH